MTKKKLIKHLEGVDDDALILTVEEYNHQFDGSETREIEVNNIRISVVDGIEQVIIF